MSIAGTNIWKVKCDYWITNNASSV
uniref:Uncharacterized protein n=1 Tax=Rhizophora mucronata TaxID=61149 RepID=A0A2P2PDG2_RHIMU